MDRRLSILIIEDFESDAELILHHFRKAQYDITHERVETAAEMRAAFERQSWDLVIADYNLPEFNAPSALAILQETGLDIPFIVVSGTIGEEKAVALMKAGAHDYVMKANLARLIPAVKRELGEARSRQARRDADQAVRESERHYRSLFDNMLNGFAYCRMLFEQGRPKDFIYLETNKAFETMTGLKDVAGKKVSEVIPGIQDSNPEIIQFYGRVASTGKPERAEFFIKALNMWFLVSSYCPEKEHFVAVFDVITERKKAEQALRESEEKYRTIFENAIEGIYQSIPADRFITVNPAMARIYGYDSPEDMIKSVTDIGKQLFVSPEDRETYLSKLNEYGQASNFEHRVYRKDGSIIWVSLSGHAVKGADGKVLFHEGIAEDINSRKLSERALARSESRLRSLIETTTDWIWEADEMGRYTNASAKIKDLLGYEPEEVLGKRPLDFMPPDEALRIEPFLLDTVQFPRPFSGLENIRLRKDGRMVVLETSGAPLFDEHGNFAGYMGFDSDITRRKRAEDEREKTLQWQQGINVLQQSLLSPSMLEEKLTTVADAIVRLFDADFARIWVIRPGDLCEQGCIHAGLHEESHICRYRDLCLHLLASSGRYTHTDGMMHRRIPFDCYKIGRIASGGDHKFLTNDMQDAPWIHDHEWARELGLVSFAGYQLRVPGGKTLGVLALFAKHPILSTEDAVLDGLTSAVALVIQKDLAEKSVRESEEKYRSIFENALEGICQVTPEGQFITVNPAMARIYGYDSPEEMMKSVTDIRKQLYAFPEERTAYVSKLKEYGKVNNFEHQGYKKDGSIIWTSLSSQVVEAASGEVFFEAMVEDITARRQAEEDLKETMEKLRKSLVGTIQAMSLIVEVRDPYTAGHQKSVSNLARVIAQEMALPDHVVDAVRMAGIIHDIGKISVPAEILSKPTKLTDIEFNLIKVHSQAGYDVLKDVGLPYPVAEIVLQHHERLDGSGYPQGLKNGEILLEAQIIAVADVVEAIASHRPYRPGRGIDAALDEIEKSKGILYDAGVVDACIKLFREKGFNFLIGRDVKS